MVPVVLPMLSVNPSLRPTVVWTRGDRQKDWHASFLTLALCQATVTHGWKQGTTLHVTMDADQEMAELGPSQAMVTVWKSEKGNHGQTETVLNKFNSFPFS
jgi:hypothetical protein